MIRVSIARYSRHTQTVLWWKSRVFTRQMKTTSEDCQEIIFFPSSWRTNLLFCLSFSSSLVFFCRSNSNTTTPWDEKLGWMKRWWTANERMNERRRRCMQKKEKKKMFASWLSFSFFVFVFFFSYIVCSTAAVTLWKDTHRQIDIVLPYIKTKKWNENWRRQQRGRRRRRRRQPTTTDVRQALEEKEIAGCLSYSLSYSVC